MSFLRRINRIWNWRRAPRDYRCLICPVSRRDSIENIMKNKVRSGSFVTIRINGVYRGYEHFDVFCWDCGRILNKKRETR